MKSQLLLATALLGASSIAGAIAIPVTASSGSGSYNNSVTLIHDGFVPAENTVWTAASNVWWVGTAPVFTLDFGQTYWLEDALVSVDNNDAYLIETSVDNTVWTTLFDIAVGDGEIPVIPGGMDTMSSVSGDGEYVASTEFAATQARYARIRATGGDNFYSVGELSFTGREVPSGNAPAPATLALLGLGLAGIARLRRRHD